MNNMKITAVLILLAALCLQPIAAGVMNPEELFKAAAARDTEMQGLLLETETTSLKTDLEDYKRGFGISAGIENDGTKLSGINGTEKPVLDLQPFIELSLPEDTGTSIRAAVPFTHSFNDNKTGTSISMNINQDISELFNMKKQETADDIRRNNAEHSLAQRIRARRAEIEENVLNLIRTLLELEKSMIVNSTSLNEKETQLQNLLRAGMIAHNSSSHLSKLMELRTLESETEELEIEYRTKSEQFYRLTGVRLGETPLLPEIVFPELREQRQQTVAAAESALLLEEAVLDDMSAAQPPLINLTIGGSSTIESELKPEFSAGLDSGFEDFSFSVNGSWSRDSGGTLSAGLKFNPADRKTKRLKEEIQRQNIESARIDLERAVEDASETIRGIISELRKLDNRSRNLEINSAFVDKYFEEMEAKFEMGLIPESEIIKARDQKRGIELDGAILNTDRYLLANRISNLYED